MAGIGLRVRLRAALAACALIASPIASAAQVSPISLDAVVAADGDSGSQVSRKATTWIDVFGAVRLADGLDVRARPVVYRRSFDGKWQTQIYEMALRRQQEGKIVFVDIEGTTNENLFAGLYCADIVLIPLQTTQDDVVAGMQLALNHIPVVEEDQKRKLPALIVINQHDLVTGRAKAHEPLREILRESGVALASHSIARRASYQSIGAAGTLQTLARPDLKAIAEMEMLLGELLSLYISAASEAKQ